MDSKTRLFFISTGLEPGNDKADQQTKKGVSKDPYGKACVPDNYDHVQQQKEKENSGSHPDLFENELCYTPDDDGKKRKVIKDKGKRVDIIQHFFPP